MQKVIKINKALFTGLYSYLNKWKAVGYLAVDTDLPEIESEASELKGR